MPVARGERRVLLVGQRRRDVPQRIGEAQPDHIARGRCVGHLGADVAAGRADRVGDDSRRVCERAVPVEHEQAEAPVRRITHRDPADLRPAGNLRDPPAAATRSAKARRRSDAQATGVRHAGTSRLQAGVLASSRFHAKSPYLSSPASGKPRCVRCTRIWCVRPVRSSASSSDSGGTWRGHTSTRRKIVSAACPSSSMRTRRSPSWLTNLCTLSVSLRIASRQRPRTSTW